MDNFFVSSIRNSKYFIMTLGIIIITATYAAIMISLKCAPFGSGLLICGDNVPSLLPGIQELKNKLANSQSISYTWGVNGGVNYYSLFVFSFLNPLTLILIAVPTKHYDIALNIGMLIHSILMYISMYMYLTNRLAGKRLKSSDSALLVFGISYALLPEFINMGCFYPFMTVLAVFPLAILGLESYTYKGKWKLYVVALILLLISNYYMAFVAFVFIFFYYFTLDIKSIKCLAIKGVKILLISIISIGMTSFFVIPVAVTAIGGYGFSENHGIAMMTKWLNIFSQILMFRSPILTGDIDVNWQANLYCGTVVFILGLSYFFIRKYSVVTRVKRLVFLAVLIASFNIPFLNWVFHLFHVPHGLPNRHAVFVLFYIIALAVDAFSYYVSESSRKSVIGFVIASFVIIVIDIITWIFSNCNAKEGMSYIITIILSILYILLVVLLAFNKYKIFAVYAIAIISVIEVCYNYKTMFRGNVLSYTPLYTIYEETESIMSEIKVDSDFYRTSFNDKGYIFEPGMAFGNKSVCGYSSSCNSIYNIMLSGLGISGDKLGVGESGYTPLINSMVSRKYIVESDANVSEQEECLTNEYDSIFEQYELINQENGYNTYYNNKSINPILVSDNEASVYLDSSVEDKTPVTNNNALCNMLTGIDDIMEEAGMDIEVSEFNNCVAAYDGSKIYLSNNTLGYIGVDYNKSKDSSVTLTLMAKESGDYYIMGNGFNHLGYLDKGESKKIKYEVDRTMFNNGDMTSLDISTMTFDNDKFEEAYKILKSNEMNITSYTDNSITGTLRSNGNHLVFTTIPYDKGWSIYVDGKQVETESINEAFLTFHVPDGEHDIYMEYHVRGLVPGIILSIVFAAIGIFVIIRDKKKSA